MIVLIVSRDTDALKNNSEYLVTKDCCVLPESNAKDALTLATLAEFAVIDLDLPDVDGFGLARAIKERRRLPVLFLTGPCADGDMERALASGGDYIKKPYSPKELHLRIEAMMKKSPAENDGIVRLPPLFIDTRRLSVRIREKGLFLTPREYSLLMALCGSPNQKLTNEALFKELWGNGDVSSHLVQQNVSTLRNKLESAAPDIKFIQTVHGSGYIFRYPPEVVKKSRKSKTRC